MFGKKEDINLTQLKVGYTLKTQGVTWEIVEHTDYDWGPDGKSIEYKVRAQSRREAFIEVERFEGDYEIYFSEQTTLDSATIEDAIVSESIVFNGDAYKREEHYRGASKNNTLGTSWLNVETHLFYSENDLLLNIEIFDGETPNVYFGKEIKAKDLKNINPKS